MPVTVSAIGVRVTRQALMRVSCSFVFNCIQCSIKHLTAVKMMLMMMNLQLRGRKAACFNLTLIAARLNWGSNLRAKQATYS
jgi:hypothetical protein